jgi:hypothetical protein
VDVFEFGEFELLYRPSTIAGLTGRINAAGLARLAEHPSVVEVGLDVMNIGCTGQAPDACDRQDLKDASALLLNGLVAPPSMNEVLSASGGSSQTSMACSTAQFVAVLEQRAGSSEINWKVNDEPGPTQNETFISASPTQPGLLLTGWNDGMLPATPVACTFFQVQAVTTLFTTSTDFGNTWTPAFGFFGDPLLGTEEFDPACAIGGNGNLYIGLITFRGSDSPVAFSRSTDGGQTFEALQAIPGSVGTFADKELLAADPDPTRGDRVYTVWSDFTGTNSGSIMFNRSLQGGAVGTWAFTPNALTLYQVPLDAALDRFAIAAVPVVGPHGELYTVWLDSGPGFRTQENNELILLRRSADAGNTWWPPLAAGPEVVDTIDDIENNLGSSCFGLPNTQFRAGTVPAVAVDRSGCAFHGRVYVVYDAEDASNDADIFVRAGDWNDVAGQIDWVTPTGIRVNDDSTTHSQFFPWIAVDDEGHVGVMWYDRRNDPNNVMFDVYFAFSTDGGQTFSPNLLVTDVISDPTTAPTFIGDYNGLAAQDNAFFATWADLRNNAGNDDGDIYTARIAIEPVPAVDWVCDAGLPKSSTGNGASDETCFIFPQSYQASITDFVIQMSEDIDVGVAASTDDITSTGGAAPTDLTLTPETTAGQYTLTLDAPLPQQEWTTITFTARSTATGAQGTVCIRVGHLPCDVNQDGNVGLADASAFVNEFNGLARVCLVDSNHDGAVGLADVSDWVNNFNGNPSVGIPPANGTFLPAKPACP